MCVHTGYVDCVCGPLCSHVCTATICDDTLYLSVFEIYVFTQGGFVDCVYGPLCSHMCMACAWLTRVHGVAANVAGVYHKHSTACINSNGKSFSEQNTQASAARAETEREQSGATNMPLSTGSECFVRTCVWATERTARALPRRPSRAALFTPPPPLLALVCVCAARAETRK